MGRQEGLKPGKISVQESGEVTEVRGITNQEIFWQTEPYAWV